MKYHLVQLGCQMNQSDGERIAAVLNAMGYEATESEEDAELLGVVACSVRQKAIDKVYSKIDKWNSWKLRRNLLTFVSGCVLPSDKEKFLTRFDLLFDIADLPRLPALISQYGVVTPLSLDADRQAHATSVASQENSGRENTAPADAGTFTNGLSPQGHSSHGLPSIRLAEAGPGVSLREIPQFEARRRSTLQAIRMMQATLEDSGGVDGVRARAFAKGGESAPSDTGPDEGSGSADLADPLESFWNIKPSYTSSFEAFVPIQNGCDKMCSFCAVPYTRGREVSRPSEEILSQVRELLVGGYKSITLLGQNVNSYGLDKPGAELSFAALLREVGRLCDDHRTESGQAAWVYFTSPHPRDMSDEVLHAIGESPSLAKQIHLPLQSGDDKLLLRMNRNYSMERYRKVAESVRRILPQATLFTDIIVGFTGETDEQFAATKAAMREFSYNMAFVAMYSPRPGAASSRWDDDIPLDTKKARLHELSQILQETSMAYNARLVGSSLPILVDGHDRKSGFLSGRTEGKVQVRFAMPEGFSETDLVGKFVSVRIESAQAMSVEGSFEAYAFSDRQSVGV